MILLTDNDVLVKLSQCDLVGEGLAALDGSFGECFILESAKYSLYLNDRNKCVSRYLGNDDAFDRLGRFVANCKELGSAPGDLDYEKELLLIDGMDAGEQQLFLHAKSMADHGDDYTIATGDRRALRGVIQSQSEQTKALLKGKTECLESILIKMIGACDYGFVNGKICQAMGCTDARNFDSVLKMAFGVERSEDHAIDCLKNFMSPVAGYLRP